MILLLRFDGWSLCSVFHLVLKQWLAGDVPLTSIALCLNKWTALPFYKWISINLDTYSEGLYNSEFIVRRRAPRSMFSTLRSVEYSRFMSCLVSTSSDIEVLVRLCGVCCCCQMCFVAPSSILRQSGWKQCTKASHSQSLNIDLYSIIFLMNGCLYTTLASYESKKKRQIQSLCFEIFFFF